MEDPPLAGSSDPRVVALERRHGELARDVATVWTLERAFEERMLERVAGWCKEITDMRNSVVEQVEAGNLALVEAALRSTKEQGSTNATVLRAMEAKLEPAVAEAHARCSTVEGRVKAVEAFEDRLGALERRAEAAEAALAAADLRAAAALAASDRAHQEHLARFKQMENRFRAGEKVAAANYKRSRKSRPLSLAVTRLSTRLHTALTLDAAAAAAADGDTSWAKSTLTELRTMGEDGRPSRRKFVRGPRGSLLEQLSQPGSCGGERLVAQYGITVNAAEVDKREAAFRERRRSERRASYQVLRRTSTLAAQPRHHEVVVAHAPAPAREPLRDVVGGRPSSEVVVVVAAPAAAAPAGRSPPEEGGQGEEAASQAELDERFPGGEEFLSEDEEEGGEETVLADSILALLRRVALLESTKVDVGTVVALTETVARLAARAAEVERLTQGRFSAVEASVVRAGTEAVRLLEAVRHDVAVDRERAGMLAQNLTSVQFKVERLDGGHMDSVRDCFAPTLDQVQATACFVETFARETNKSLDLLETHKAAKQDLADKADIGAVESKAARKDFDSLNSALSTMSLTLDSLSARLDVAEKDAKGGKSASLKLDALIGELRQKLAKLAKKGGSRETPNQKPLTLKGSLRDGDHSALSEEGGRTTTKLSPLKRPSKMKSDDGGLLILRGSTSSPAVALHVHREQWQFPDPATVRARLRTPNGALTKGHKQLEASSSPSSTTTPSLNVIKAEILLPARAGSPSLYSDTPALSTPPDSAPAPP